jgi:hypothetical protein
VHWFGDNDVAGERVLHLLRQVLPPARVQAGNELYRSFQDCNDLLPKAPPTWPRGRSLGQQVVAKRRATGFLNTIPV